MVKPLPKKYAWLHNEGGPRMIVEFIKIHGIDENPGKANDPDIMSWARELGYEKTYTADSIPWCGLCMGIIAKRAGKDITPVGNILWALNWAKFGNPVEVPMLGDVLVFKRDGGGHVGLYIGEDADYYHVGGGNQSDDTSITRIAKSRLYRARRPHYNNQPANVRRIWLSASGAVSKNEA